MEARPGPPGSRLGDRFITHPCKKGPITETKLKFAGITMDQRR